MLLSKAVAYGRTGKESSKSCAKLKLVMVVSAEVGTYFRHSNKGIYSSGY